MELRNTIEMMTSEDYKERFKAEYWQTKIRYEKLHKMTIKYEANKLNFTPSCSLDLLNEQKKHMGMYLHCLEVRAEIEGISLENIEVQKEYLNYLTSTLNNYTYPSNATATTAITNGSVNND